jgi:hypothetical protein
MITTEASRWEAFDGEWREAHRELLRNVRLKPFVSRHELSVCAILQGKKTYLPAYVPYIGPGYFRSRPRILCYAINQNLSPHVGWTQDWVTSWATDVEHAWDRLNLAASQGRAIPIRPYAEGFIPLVALIAGLKWQQTNGGQVPDCIDEVVTVTNFVKFSTAQDASSSSIPLAWWRQCAQQYADREIRTLRPDIIVAFGQRTEQEVERVLALIGDADLSPILLGCRFPARIPSLRARPLTKRESEIWDTTIKPLTMRMRQPPPESYHRWKIDRYPGYFVDVAREWELIS